jgi:hypothetical protein
MTTTMTPRYAVGTINVVLSVLIAALLVAYVPGRAYRGFVLPFAVGTAMPIYAAMRGMCIEQWTRNVRQLRAWEMAREEDERGAGVRMWGVPEEPEEAGDGGGVAMSDIAPWAEPGAGKAAPAASARDSEKHPRIFGPGVIVQVRRCLAARTRWIVTPPSQDPRIRRLQTRAVLAILLVSFVYTLASVSPRARSRGAHVLHCRCSASSCSACRGVDDRLGFFPPSFLPLCTLIIPFSLFAVVPACLPTRPLPVRHIVIVRLSPVGSPSRPPPFVQSPRRILHPLSHGLGSYRNLFVPVPDPVAALS